MINYHFTLEQINSMKHCIGFNKSKITGTKYRKMKAYRNHYVTDNNNESLDDLVEQGVMTKRNYQLGVGDDSQVYHVTEEGFKFLSDLTGIEITEME